MEPMSVVRRKMRMVMKPLHPLGLFRVAGLRLVFTIWPGTSGSGLLRRFPVAQRKPLSGEVVGVITLIVYVPVIDMEILRTLVLIWLVFDVPDEPGLIR